MRNPKDSSRLYFLRRHLQLAHARGVLSSLEYHAALEFLLDREEEALRNRDGKIPFHYDRPELLRQGLRVLEQHRVLSRERVEQALALPIAETPPLTPIFDETEGDAEDLAAFTLLCPGCEAEVPAGSAVCPACNRPVID